MWTVPDKILPAYRQIMDNWKAKNIIYPGEANYPVKMFPKVKPNGEIRLLADLVARKDITIKNDRTIPNHLLILRTVVRAKYRSTIALSNWYFQIQVALKMKLSTTLKRPSEPLHGNNATTRYQCALHSYASYGVCP